MLLRCSMLLQILLTEATAAAATASNKVVVGNARFTVLTDSLIRMEAGAFNDLPSLIFQTREEAPEVEFTAERSANGGVVISTRHVRLNFHPGAIFSGTFSSSNLAVEFDLNATHRGSWSPGMQDTDNLKGTLSSMDCYDDPAVCASQARSNIGSGLISRAGWVLVDDTHTPLWAAESTNSATSHWPWWQSASKTNASRSDQYLFAHGHRYTDALRDFTLVAGRMDMPPLSAFGVWWSRYWVYSVGVPAIAQDIVTDVLDGYRDHALPLNHLVMDMDWHTASSQYSWNTKLVPDPVGWMADLHSDSNPLGHPLKYLVVRLQEVS